MKKKKVLKRVTVQVQNTLALPSRAEATAKLLRNLSAVFAELFADENFVTLLQAESQTTIPGKTASQRTGLNKGLSDMHFRWSPSYVGKRGPREHHQSPNHSEREIPKHDDDSNNCDRDSLCLRFLDPLRCRCRNWHSI